MLLGETGRDQGSEVFFVLRCRKSCRISVLAAMHPGGVGGILFASIILVDTIQEVDDFSSRR